MGKETDFKMRGSGSNSQKTSGQWLILLLICQIYKIESRKTKMLIQLENISWFCWTFNTISFILISDSQINLLQLATKPNESPDKPNCGIWVFTL